MKKLLVKGTAVFLCMMLCACGASEPEKEKPSSAEEESAEQETEKKEEVKEVPFESFTAFDNDEVSVTVKELDPDDMWGYAIKTEMENKSDSTTYMFAVEAVTVDGVGVNTLNALDVAPGKKANEDIVFSSAELAEHGLTDYTDIEVLMRIYDDNNWEKDPVVYDSFHIYPQGKDNLKRYVREAEDSDTVLVDDDNVSVIVTGYEEDDIWGYTVKMFMVNKTGKRLMYAVEDASVNGYMADPFYANSLEPNTCEFTDMSWSDTALEEISVDKVENIEFKLMIYDEDDFGADHLVDETITLKP